MHLSLLFAKYLNSYSRVQEREIKGKADEALEGSFLLQSHSVSLGYTDLSM